jgi:hypothetical protein
MIKCQYCGSGSYPDSTHCQKCAAPLPVSAFKPVRVAVAVSMDAPKPKPVATQMSWKELGVYFGSAFLMVGLVLAGLYFWSRLILPSNVTTAAPVASVSDTRMIQSPGGILLATTEENFSEMMKAAVAGDDACLMRMGVDGKVFRLQDNTKIRIVDGGMFKSKVSALEGNQSGRSGWLPNEFISK